MWGSVSRSQPPFLSLCHGHSAPHIIPLCPFMSSIWLWALFMLPPTLSTPLQRLSLLYNLLGSSIFSPLLKKKKIQQTITFHLSVSILAYVFWNCILRYTPYLGSRYYSDARKRFPDPGDNAFCVIFMTWNLLGPMNVPALADQISFLILLYLLVKKICILLLNPLNCQTLDRTTIWTNGGYVD